MNLYNTPLRQWVSVIGGGYEPAAIGMVTDMGAVTSIDPVTINGLVSGRVPMVTREEVETSRKAATGAMDFDMSLMGRGA